MSKRFGRNQRRRAREALENIQRLLSMSQVKEVETQRVNAKLFAENTLLRRQVDTVRDALGDVIILPPATIYMSESEFNSYIKTGVRVPRKEKVHSVEYSPMEKIQLQAERLEIDTLHAIKANYEQIPDWAMTKHFMISTSSGKNVAYVVDEKSFFGKLKRSEAEQRMLELITHEFYAYLRNEEQKD